MVRQLTLVPLHLCRRCRRCCSRRCTQSLLCIAPLVAQAWFMPGSLQRLQGTQMPCDNSSMCILPALPRRSVELFTALDGSALVQKAEVRPRAAGRGHMRGREARRERM